MKTPLKSSSWHRLFIPLSGLLLLGATAQAQIIANFDDGETTTEVDGWTGMAGSGWKTAWSRSEGSAITSYDTTVESTNPFIQDSQRLQMAVVTTGTGGAANVGVARQFEAGNGVNPASAHQISFYMRWDSGKMDRFYASDNDAETRSGGDTSSTWFVRTLSTGWAIFDGGLATGNRINTGFAVIEGHNYHLTVDVDPATKTWSIVIANLTNETSYSSDTLGFVNDLEASAGYLNFATYITRAVEGDSATTSIGNITVIPEPAHISMLMGGIILGLLALRRIR